MTTSIYASYQSVIYDFECSQSLIIDKSRFADEIISANDWIKSSNKSIKVENSETMMINDHLNIKSVKMTFKQTAYISSTDVTLISQSKLMKVNYDRDMYSKKLIQKSFRKQVCDIQKHYEMFLLQYNLIDEENDEKDRIKNYEHDEVHQMN